jgi:hypothetical protein
MPPTGGRRGPVRHAGPEACERHDQISATPLSALKVGNHQDRTRHYPYVEGMQGPRYAPLVEDGVFPFVARGARG